MAHEFSLQPIQVEPAYRVAARSIRDRIVGGEIAVGTALPSEMAMAALLGVNRSTVREAIRLLEENGVVARRPGGKRLYVTVPKRADLSSRMSAAMVLQQITAEELWGAMMALEPAAAAAAARNVTPDQIAALDANLARTAGSLTDRQAILELDLEFHELIAEACGNRAIQLSREPIGELFYPAFEAVFGLFKASGRLLAAHTAITDALKAGDSATAETWMRKHIVDFRRGYELAGLDMTKPVKEP